MTTASSKPGDDPKSHSQALTFMLGEETYGIDILRVQEIRGWSAVTKIPASPAHVLGVLNLRGSIVPIVDLRKRFDLEHVDYTATTVVIVLSVNVSNGKKNVGVVVDAVSDVVDIPLDSIEPAPDLGSEEATKHVQGIATVGERMIILLNIDRLTGLSAATAQDEEMPMGAEMERAS